MRTSLPHGSACRFSPLRNERGFVLVVVIAAIGLLALAAAGFAQVTRSHVRAAASTLSSSTAGSLADAGVQLAVLDLLAARQDPAYQRRFTVGGSPFVCDADKGQRLAVSVTDEAGKIDINVADQRLLQALLAGLGASASQAIADAILDFRDNDSTRRPMGAEQTDYAAAGRAGPKNAPFSAIEEIEQVLGIDADLAVRLRPHITVHSGQPGVNEVSASRELLAILARGAGGATAADPADGGPASQNEEGGMQRLPAFPGAQGGRVFSVRSQGYADGGIVVREAIVEAGDARPRPYTFLRWRRASLTPDEALPLPADAPPCP